MLETRPKGSFDTSLRRLHLIQELDLSIATIKSGLYILQRSRAHETQHFLLMLILSTGIERLMKCLLCLRSLNDNGRFLTDRELRRFGHDLVALRNAVLERCYGSEALGRPAMKDDYDFLCEDALLNAILAALSDFGREDRYVYMNGINNPDGTGEWLDRRWEQIEGMTMPVDEGIRLVMDGNLRDYKSRSGRAITVCCERFLCALARTVTLSDLNSEAQSLGTAVFDFLFMREEDLGQTLYELENQ